MKKNYLIISLVALVLFSFPLSLCAMDYQHKLEVKNMQVSWTIEGDLIHVLMSAKTTGWVAIGFDPENAMQGANIIIGAVKNGKVKIEDHYGDRKRGHSSDVDLGGKNDVLNPEGSETDGMTTLSFTLPIKTDDAYDKPIDPKGTGRIMLAYGKGKDSFKTRHPYRAVYDINYATGESKKIK